MRSGLADIARNIGSYHDTASKMEAVDIITFTEEWCGVRLFPVQRVILKAHYGLELEDSPRGFNEELLTTYGTEDLWLLAREENPRVRETEKQNRALLIRTIMRKTIVVYEDDAPWRKRPTTAKWLTERGYLHFLNDQGRSNIREVIPGIERRELILSIGRRSGKTHISACIAAYETYRTLLKSDPQHYYGLPPGEDIQLISVATDTGQAGILYNKVKGLFNACDYFAAYRANSTQTFARFQTPKDIGDFGRWDANNGAQASINVTFRSCIAKGLRGAGNLVAILDEVAHFTNAGQSSAEEIYNAINPSLSALTPKDPDDKTRPLSDISEGRMILISSPLGRQGQFYELFQLAMKGGMPAANMLAIQAPTWEVNPTIPAGEFEKNYAKDANTFLTEYGGEFSSRTLGWLEVRQDLLDCIEPGLKPRIRGLPRIPHFLGIDFALAGDGTAVAIGHIEGDKVKLDLVEEIRVGLPGPYQNLTRLEFDDVADWILDLSRRYLIEEGMFDQWAGIVFEQALQKRGLNQCKSHHMTGPITSQIYKNFKDMIYEKRLVLYDDMPDVEKVGMSEDAFREAAKLEEDDAPDGAPQGPISYLQELLELQATVKSKYVVEVEAPKVNGKHDDRSDALARMIWMASQRLGNMKYIAGQNMALSRGAGAREAALVKSRLNARLGGISEQRQVRRMGRRGGGRGAVLGVRGGRLKG